MTLERFKQRAREEWELFRGEPKPKEKLTHPLWRTLYRLGTVMMLVGMLLFMIYGVFQNPPGEKGPARLDTPAPILGVTQLYLENDRLYLFLEHKTAVNVYKTDGTFLFRIQAPHYSNGFGMMRLWEKGIYITTRNHALYRFDREGNYLGKGEDGQVVDRAGRFLFAYGDQAEYFDEDGVWYTEWVEEEKTYVWFYNNGVDPQWLEGSEYMTDRLIVERLGGRWADSNRRARDGDGTTYSVSMGRLYKTADGKQETLARTSFLPLYLHNPLWLWLTALAGLLLSNWSVRMDKRSRQKSKAAPEDEFPR